MTGIRVRLYSAVAIVAASTVAWSSGDCWAVSRYLDALPAWW